MPNERLAMRKVRGILRRKHELGLSYREVAEGLGGLDWDQGCVLCF
jgi:hypothetical protein